MSSYWPSKIPGHRAAAELQNNIASMDNDFEQFKQEYANTFREIYLNYPSTLYGKFTIEIYLENCEKIPEIVVGLFKMFGANYSMHINIYTRRNLHEIMVHLWKKT